MTSRRPYWILGITESDCIGTNQSAVRGRLCWTRPGFCDVKYNRDRLSRVFKCQSVAEINVTITMPVITIIIRHYGHKNRLSHVTPSFDFLVIENKCRVRINLCGSVGKCIGSAEKRIGIVVLCVVYSFLYFYIVFFTPITWVRDSSVRWTPCECSLQTLFKQVSVYLLRNWVIENKYLLLFASKIVISERKSWKIVASCVNMIYRVDSATIPSN